MCPRCGKKGYEQDGYEVDEYGESTSHDCQKQKYYSHSTFPRD